MNVMRIRELRKAAGLTVSQLAAKMGVHVQVIHAWEMEIYLPKARELPVLAQTLGCAIDDLFIREEAV